MLRSPVLRADWLKPRIKGGIIPFHKRVQQELRVILFSLTFKGGEREALPAVAWK